MLAPIWGWGLADRTVIAIIDDDEAVRDALAGLMKSLGYGAEAFESAEDFLGSSRRDSASCLITDVQMPGMSGLELHDKLVASGKPIPTILITAYPNERVRTRALRHGIVCYLAKPFQEDELLACMRSALKSNTAGNNET